jgi:hypothetical protein
MRELTDDEIPVVTASVAAPIVNRTRAYGPTRPALEIPARRPQDQGVTR